jgi:NAD(P)H dehydrogenase (quinone)
MKIGVSGASGHLGKAVVSELLQPGGGHEVVAITRTPKTVSGPAQGRFGDYNQPAIDAAARAGVKHVVFMSAVGTRQEEEPARGASYWRGEQHLIATAPAWTTERARLIAEITGRPVAFRVITEEQLRAGLTKAGLPAGAVNTVVSIQASFAAGAFDILTGDVERLGGRPPKPLRDGLAGVLRP